MLAGGSIAFRWADQSHWPHATVQLFVVEYLISDLGGPVSARRPARRRSRGREQQQPSITMG